MRTAMRSTRPPLHLPGRVRLLMLRGLWLVARQSLRVWLTADAPGARR